MNNKVKYLSIRFIQYSFLISFCIIWLLPLFYFFATVMKTQEQYLATNFLEFTGSIPQIWINMITIWNKANIAPNIINSLFYGVSGAGTAVFFASMAAYGLTRFKFSEQTLLFLLIFSGTLFPFHMYLIPLFQNYSKFGLYDTRIGMVLIYTAICIPFCVLVLRNYMLQISYEQDEAAIMDGNSHWQIFFNIILPNCKGPITALFLIQFMWIWNDLIFGMILASSTNTQSIMAKLISVTGPYATTPQPEVMALVLISTFPVLTLFIFMRKNFMNGLKMNY